MRDTKMLNFLIYKHHLDFNKISRKFIVAIPACEQTLKKGFLLKQAMDLFRWGTGATMTF